MEIFHPVHAFLPTVITKVPVPTIQRSTTALNGIKGFRAWFESQFPSAILQLPRAGAQEKFDHVLIDMNQLLHIALRRSRSEGHALTILMKELDACCALASPTKSVVLAMDGPPSAAKLATQRRRRFSTFVRAEWKQEQLSRFRKSFSPEAEARKRRRYSKETKTLCITPGTAFMDRAQQALLYWAWQRMQNPNNVLSRVKIYISSSNVHGEGEVKLLDWILQQDRHGESIAILGGDSDLVLEGLVIPPSSTHNIFVLLPDGNKRYFSVSLWETTRALSKFLPALEAADVMRVRTDMVLLLILNGNDYLPKLRGSSGFNKIFHTYLRLLHQWLDDKEAHPQAPFLVDPDTLEFNLAFCVAFFRQMAQLAPPKSFLDQKQVRTSRKTPLGNLNVLIDAGFVPRPKEWTLISADGEAVKKDKADEEKETEEQLLMRLRLGKSDTGDFFEYETWHNAGDQLKQTKHRLAAIALDDLMGTDYNSDEDGENGDEDDTDYLGITNSGYSWEVQHAVPGKVDLYLAGLLWNIQTYQDGVCADYAYNYGRRLSPTAREIVDFFKTAMRENRTVGRRELLGETFSPAVSAGLSCLAALPSQVRDLIPEPYKRLSNTTVEDIYASCMDPEDNRFDLKRFERLCEQCINEMVNRGDIELDDFEIEQRHFDRHGRRIITGDHYWTVLSKQGPALVHPFDPPPPFSDRLSQLRPNRRMRVSRVMATAEPRPRSVWSGKGAQRERKPRARDSKGRFARHEPREVKHADLGGLLDSGSGKDIGILDVGYRRAYQAFERKRDKKKSKRKRMKFDLAIPEIKMSNGNKVPKKNKKGKAVTVPKDLLQNVEGFPPLMLLNQLRDSKMIGDISWDYTASSPNSTDVDEKEIVQLIVRKGDVANKAVLHEDLTYEHEREVNFISRQSVRQRLSSFALCEILGPEKRWSEMTFKEIKGYLTRKEQTSLKSNER